VPGNGCYWRMRVCSLRVLADVGATDAGGVLAAVAGGVLAARWGYGCLSAAEGSGQGRRWVLRRWPSRAGVQQPGRWTLRVLGMSGSGSWEGGRAVAGVGASVVWLRQLWRGGFGCCGGVASGAGEASAAGAAAVRLRVLWDQRRCGGSGSPLGARGEGARAAPDSRLGAGPEPGTGAAAVLRVCHGKGLII
jgi:hypothetical protein